MWLSLPIGKGVPIPQQHTQRSVNKPTRVTLNRISTSKEGLSVTTESYVADCGSGYIQPIQCHCRHSISKVTSTSFQHHVTRLRDVSVPGAHGGYGVDTTQRPTMALGPQASIQCTGLLIALFMRPYSFWEESGRTSAQVSCTAMYFAAEVGRCQERDL